MSLPNVGSLGIALALPLAASALIPGCSYPQYSMWNGQDATGGTRSDSPSESSASSQAFPSGGGNNGTLTGGDVTNSGGVSNGSNTAGASKQSTAGAGHSGSLGGAADGGQRTNGGDGGVISSRSGSLMPTSSAMTATGTTENSATNTGGTLGAGGARAAGAAGGDAGGTLSSGSNASGAIGTSASSSASAGGGNGGSAQTGTGGVATSSAMSTGGTSTGTTFALGGTAGTADTSRAGTNGSGLDPDLVLWYKLDDPTGTSALDSSGYARTGTIKTMGNGSAAYSTTRQVGTGSLNLTSTSSTDGSYVVVPSSLQAMGVTTEATLACWVYTKSNTQKWERAFDFGSSSSTSYMFLALDSSSSCKDSPCFAITTAGLDAEQRIAMATTAPLSVGAWHHLAVVLGAGSTYTGTLYVDGEAVGTNAAMTLRPADLGASPNNWLGRSQYSADPLLNAMLDDFRIYKRALTTTEIVSLFAQR
jgi:hypothetical protein